MNPAPRNTFAMFSGILLAARRGRLFTNMLDKRNMVSRWKAFDKRIRKTFILKQIQCITVVCF